MVVAMSEDQEPPTWAETVTKALVAAVPYVGGSAQVVWEDVRKRRAAAAQQSLQEIVLDCGEERLPQRLTEDPLLEALLVNALDACLRTGLEPNVDFLHALLLKPQPMARNLTRARCWSTFSPSWTHPTSRSSNF